MGRAVKMWLTLSTILVGGFLFISAWLFFNQKNMVFFPSSRMDATPDEIGLAYEDIRIDVGGGQTINAWYFPPDGGPVAAAPTVIFCHGNAGNISHRLETVQFLREFGAGVLLFDYRGYGRSDGSPSEVNCYADARACCDWLVDQRGCTPERLVVFGRSLGGAVAVDLAAKVPCGGLIVESSFTSAAEMGRRMLPFFPVRLVLRYRFDSIAKIGRVGCPVLITHSVDDEIIPFEHGRALYERAPEPKRFVELTGGHNEREYFASAAYREAIREMLRPAGADGVRED